MGFLATEAGTPIDYKDWGSRQPIVCKDITIPFYGYNRAGAATSGSHS